MSMTAAEARTEIKGLYTKADEIEKKYPDGLTEAVNGDDYREVKRLLEEVDGLEAKLAALDEAAQRKARLTDRLRDLSTPVRPEQGVQGLEFTAGGLVLPPGDLFVKDQTYLSLKGSGVLASNANRVELTVPLGEGTNLLRYSKHVAAQKALVWSGTGSGGALVANDVRPGVVGILQRPVVVTDLIPQVATTSDTIEYVREDTWTNNAAMVAEASATTGTSGLKPESVLVFSTQTAPVRTLAHWVPVTNRMLADAPAIRGYINTRLLGGLDQKLEDQVLTGDGTGENLLGILNTPNVLSQGVTGGDLLGAIWAARTAIQTQGFANPSVVVLHPTNFSAVRLARENSATGTLGNYLMGPPSQVGAPTIWGMDVAISLAMTVGTVLVADFGMGSTLYNREQGAIRVGYIDQQFVRNMQTILAEERVAFVTYRPQAYCKVTGAP